jgi:hypothetical protein
MSEANKILDRLKKFNGEPYFLLGFKEFSVVKNKDFLADLRKSNAFQKLIIGEVDIESYISFGRPYRFIKDGMIRLGILSNKGNFFFIIGDHSLKLARKPKEFTEDVSE